jgi:NADH:ubiquinone oxidoreductase subunit F (NADH-binding)
VTGSSADGTAHLRAATEGHRHALANVPHILAEGPDWLRANGTEGAPGTMVFTLCGDVRREGVFELPLGSPLRHLVEELAGGPPDGRAVKAIFPGASNTVIVPAQLDMPLDFDSMRQVGSGLGAGGFAVFDDSACMVQAAYRYSRFLFVESCGQCPACKFGTGKVTKPGGDRGGGGSDRDLELILVRARDSTGGQTCALPTGESLLMQSLVQGFGEEFASHVGSSCPLPRELPFHKLLDWDAAAGRFAYDLAYADKQSDWTSPS